jgi:CDP-diacylglycerol--glycerol-3-phosphate 3-phosphatidyltransferase
MSHGARTVSEPSWLNWANALTLLRVALVPVIAVLVVSDAESTRWWAFGIFVFAAATDRVVGVTRWGQVADPAADKALIVGSLAVLAHIGRLPWLAVAIIVVREIAVTVQRHLLLHRGVVMPASRYGKAKTVSQVVAITLYLVPAGPSTIADVALGIAVVLTVLSGLEYALRGRRLSADA